MAKKRKIGKAVGNAAESQTARLIGAATDKIDSLVGRAAKSANTSKRRTYIMAALAAMIVAGQAAARMRAAMSKAPSAQPVRLKASRAHKRK